VVGRQDADIADTPKLRKVAMASWQPLFGFHLDVTSVVRS